MQSFLKREKFHTIVISTANWLWLKRLAFEQGRPMASILGEIIWNVRESPPVDIHEHDALSCPEKREVFACTLKPQWILYLRERADREERTIAQTLERILRQAKKASEDQETHATH